MVAAFVGSIVSAKPSIHVILDVSWPNCDMQPSSDVVWGIVGVNGGLSFRSNPCLAQESSWFRHEALYVNTGYPGGTRALKYVYYPRKCSITNNQCLAYNYGYNSIIYSIEYAEKQLVSSNMWWLDVETENSWSDSTVVNRAALNGAVTALRQHVFVPTIGFYSYPGQWAEITGSWRNGLPAWVASGSNSNVQAMQLCRAPSFNGGQVWLGQYTKTLDENYPCSSKFMNTLDKLAQ